MPYVIPRTSNYETVFSPLNQNTQKYFITDHENLPWANMSAQSHYHMSMTDLQLLFYKLIVNSAGNLSHGEGQVVGI